jgi:predicted ATP-grasp superfamily ATP-dependent carboligase
MNLIIIGASTRAAAFSAHRAGLRPWCVDLFADADLARRFPVRKIPLQAYPEGFLAALGDAPDGPVLYTGGLENYPDLLARIDRPLWGNSPDVLRRVRDPYLLAQTLRRCGLPALEVRSGPPRDDDNRRWLLKPLRGSGGIGIRHFDGRPFSPTVHYVQEFAEGNALGGLFLGVPGEGATFLGSTRTLVGCSWHGAPPFQYGGGVVNNGDFDHALLQPLGTFLVQEFGLVGLFGIDTIVTYGRGTAMLLEVNPRYTASVELLERTFGRSLLELHGAAIGGGAIPWRPECPGIRLMLPGGHMQWHHGCFTGASPGKAIVYARRTLRFPEHGPWDQAFDQPVTAVDYADIPGPGTVIAKGHPVLTVFAEAYEGRPDLTNWWHCEQELQPKVEALDLHLYG